MTYEFIRIVFLTLLLIAIGLNLWMAIRNFLQYRRHKKEFREIHESSIRMNERIFAIIAEFNKEMERLGSTKRCHIERVNPEDMH